MDSETIGKISIYKDIKNTICRGFCIIIFLTMFIFTLQSYIVIKNINLTKEIIKIKNVGKEKQIKSKSIKYVKKPIKYIKKPIKHNKKPIKYIKKPIRYIRKPIKYIKKPIRYIRKPIKYIKKPQIEYFNTYKPHTHYYNNMGIMKPIEYNKNIIKPYY